MHVAVNTIQPLSVAMDTQEWDSLCTVAQLQNISYCRKQYKLMSVFMQSARYCLQISTKYGVSRQIFVKVRI